MLALFSLTAQDRCVEFDGEDDRIDLPDLDFSGYSAVTVEAWVKFDSLPSSSNMQGIYCVDPMNFGGAIYLHYVYLPSLPHTISFGVTTDSSSQALTYFINPMNWTGFWHHLAGTFDGDSSRLYIDGAYIGSIPSPGTIVQSTNKHWIGTLDSVPTFLSYDSHLDGRIDELRVWDKTRSLSEIQEDMNCAISEPRPNLLFVYNLNETSGSLAYDSSGNGFQGVLMNGANFTYSEVAPNCVLKLSEQEQNSVIIHPNPARDLITIETEQELTTIVLIDDKGRKIRQLIGKKSISLTELCSGTYYLILELENGEVLHCAITKQ